MDLLSSFEHYFFAEVDHLFPNGEPDRDEPNNLVLSCRACNSRLSRAQHLATFSERKEYLQSESLSKGARDTYNEYLKTLR
jgi:hypothetical protein